MAGSVKRHLQSQVADIKISAISLTATEIDDEHLILKIKLSTPYGSVHTYALIDCGATSYAFIDPDFVKTHRLSTTPLKQRYSLTVVDGRPAASGLITDYASLQMDIQYYKEELSFFITKLGYYPVVLGISWLRLHDINT